MLHTPRLYLLPLSREMLVARLHGEHFDLPCQTPQGVQMVEFHAEWPGDPLPMFPVWLSRLQTEEKDAVAHHFVAVQQETLTAIGLLGSKDTLVTHEAEIGYGFNPSYWGAGYGSEAVGALVQYLLAHTTVKVIKAQTLPTNTASQRILEKLGFKQVGLGWEQQEGDLLVWKLERS